jgi:hypothetical protein
VTGSQQPAQRLLSFSLFANSPPVACCFIVRELPRGVIPPTPPVFDDYGDENNYFVESAPTTIVHVESINSFMHVAHDRDALCDSYIVSSIHDATESYYERGKHGLMDLNNIEFPLCMTQFLKLYLFSLPKLFALRFQDLSLHKTIFHRKWFRFKCVSYLLFDALSCFKFLYSAFALSSFMAPT